jgi:hypothetical protein
MHPLLRHGFVSVLMAALFGYLSGLIAEAWGAEDAAASCRSAWLVAAGADFVAFLMLRRGLDREAMRFLALWGSALLTKFACLAAASVALLAAGQVSRNEYLLTLAAAFMVYTVRQSVVVLRLLRSVQSPRQG